MENWRPPCHLWAHEAPAGGGPGTNEKSPPSSQEGSFPLERVSWGQLGAGSLMGPPPAFLPAQTSAQGLAGSSPGPPAPSLARPPPPHCPSPERLPAGGGMASRQA